MKSDCIIYQGCRQRNGTGAGTFTIGGTRWLAHRYEWTKVHGPIPRGTDIRHTCGNVACININHLKAVVPSDDERFWAKVDKSSGPDGCWVWTAHINPWGYGRFGYNGKVVAAHRYAVKDTIPNGLYVLHKCDNRKCVNPAHLFFGTHQDNMDDMRRKGRCPPRKGSSNSVAKITEENATTIMACPDVNGAKAALARFFGIAPGTVWKIINRRAWRHVDSPSEQHFEEAKRIVQSMLNKKHENQYS